MRGPVVCLDLDRTVIYSPSALGLTMADADAPRLLCVELYQGVPLSFLTEVGAGALRALQEVATVVPTTTRTLEQLARVHLPGPPARYAIAANGGHLLVDGIPDGDWAATVRSRLTACAPLAEIAGHLQQHSGPAVLKLRTASDLFAYAVVDRAALPQPWIDELTAFCDPRGWTVSVQGRKVYAVPKPLTKSAAAREVVARCGTDRPGGATLYAAGDSLLDADLLAAADVAIRPAHGELADAGFTLEHLAVTASTGVLAGAELVQWLHHRVTAAEMSVSGTL
ncbi:HAD family hydrolase [Pseudonocardia sp. GCM10023141]|uniref:HAD family hydrolase n=1 Tax=Pseudonocardia sp. GCM10023141 TaxID=3252653 RepID=UPI0036181FE8